MHDSPEPSSVTVAGSFQDELGCSGDWKPTCAATHMDYDPTDEVWQTTLSLPAGSWEYKATLDDAWDESYGANATPNGPNITLDLAAPTDVKLYYSHRTHWITDDANAVIATVPGNFQAQLGCSGDWQPDCLRSWLQDPDGDGIYEFATDALAQGTYEAKVTHDESWTENYGQGGALNGANISFTVAQGDTVTFRYDPITHLLTIDAAGGGAAHDDNVFWDALRHDSRDGLYRHPGGAVATGTDITLRLRAASGDLTAAKLRIWDDRYDTARLLDMHIAADDGTYEYWEVTLPGAAEPTIYWYRFLAIDGTATVYYEDDADRTGGLGQPLAGSADRSWQLTIHDPAFQTPDWVKNGVIYQIFPDRFRDGDPGNNTPAGSFFYGADSTIERSMGSDWNTSVCDPRGAGIGDCPGRYSDNFYGGDLQGILDRLDYLQSLGVTVLYLNPIFESPSNHKYDTTDFLRIDDNFGVLGDPAASEQLFIDLVQAAHARGIRVVLDGVFNHSSSDSVYFDRYDRYPGTAACESETSPQRPWYYFMPAAVPGSGACAGDTDYESWFGYDSLPKLNATNPDVRDLIFAAGPESVARYWLTWADGWRLDVAGDVDPGVTNAPYNDYWERFREAVHATKPDAYIVGEEWGLATPWTLGPEWDATMNYQFSTAIMSFWRDTEFVDNDRSDSSSAGSLRPLSPSALDERLRNLEERYPAESFHALMNLLGSHDTNRPLFMLDPNTGLHDPSLYQEPTYDWSRAIERAKGVTLLQFTLPGAPTIYYGDEIGLVGPTAFDGAVWQDDPYNRIPYPWLDESGTPFYTHLQTEAGQAELRDHYTALIAARHAHPALRTGSFDTLLASDDARIYAYGRRLGSDAAVVILHRGDAARDVTLDVSGYLPVGASFTGVLGNGAAVVDAYGQLTVTGVPAQSGVLLVADTALATSPDAVTGLAVTGEQPGAIDLAWSAAAGADSYWVYRSLLSGGGFTLIGETTDTAYADSGLRNGQRYHYRVVALDQSTGLVSEPSSEVSGIPRHDLGTAWFNLQWPPEIVHTISAITPTENIYGQIWIDGYTGPFGPADGIRAQVGFGPVGTVADASWTWVDMDFHIAAGNNDEYVGQLLPDVIGDYEYVTRWSADGGETWYLADLGGPGANGQRGLLHVVPGNDLVAPSTPTGLTAGDTSPSAITLAWTGNTDIDLAGYELFRGGERIAQLDAATTSFTDSTVLADQTYEYAVLAFDTSFNRSSMSASVTATAAYRMVEVTFRVRVPAGSPGQVFLAGGFPEPLPFWTPGGIPMTPTGMPGVWETTLSLLDGTAVEYKFTRGTWEKVEKEADGNTEIANRELTTAFGDDGIQVIEDTVVSWRDPLVVGVTPAANAPPVPVDTTIQVVWSQAMHEGVQIEVTSPGGPVPGTVAYDAASFTTTFMPDTALEHGTTYDIAIRDQQDAAGDMQQVAHTSSFTTEEAPDITAPEVHASLVSRAGGEGAGFFQVRYTCTDDDPDATVYAELNGTPVPNGQWAVLILHPRQTFLGWLGNLLLLGVDQAFILSATCTDTAGNQTTATATWPEQI